MSKIPVWQMIRDAVDSIGGDLIAISDIIKHITAKYERVNEGTIRAQALACTVNRQSRTGMPENHRPRIANSKYDFLYSLGRGIVTKYDPIKHGVWEIAEQDGSRIVRQIKGIASPLKLDESQQNTSPINKKWAEKRSDIESPSHKAVLHYIKAWEALEGYKAQEIALNKLFHEFCPDNKHLEDVLLKTAALNAFYATNIYNVYAMAKHIVSLNIDDRLDRGDMTLVTDIASGHGVRNARTGKEICFYSFATKYCSHHRPLLFPIYDSYVDKLLTYLRDVDHFAEFNNANLRNSVTFKEIILKLRDYYGLNEFTLKEIDRFLWQYGKEKF